jgi:hypothetical protein
MNFGGNGRHSGATRSVEPGIHNHKLRGFFLLALVLKRS